MVGLDRSPTLLRVARSRTAGPTTPAPRFEPGDLRSFTVPGCFSLVVLPGRAFQGLLSPDAQRGCLDSIHRHLLPDGRLVIHLPDLDEEREERLLRRTCRQEMRWLLWIAGFVPVLELGDLRGGAPGTGREQVWIARKVDRPRCGLPR